MAKRVYLSPSDQRRNTYAVGDTTEDVQCGRIAAACKAALERSGVEVMVGQYDTMANRVAASNRFKADLHVPIHTNAANGKATGTHIFCYDADREQRRVQGMPGGAGCAGAGDAGGSRRGAGVSRAVRGEAPRRAHGVYRGGFPRCARCGGVDHRQHHGYREAIAKGLCAGAGRQFCAGGEHPGAGACAARAGGDGARAAVRVLRRGMTGVDVRTLQAALNAGGFDCGAADGAFGAATETALKRFQGRYKLGADGIAGKGTWGKLLGV